MLFLLFKQFVDRFELKDLLVPKFNECPRRAEEIIKISLPIFRRFLIIIGIIGLLRPSFRFESTRPTSSPLWAFQPTSTLLASYFQLTLAALVLASGLVRTYFGSSPVPFRSVYSMYLSVHRTFLRNNLLLPKSNSRGYQRRATCTSIITSFPFFVF